MDKQQLMMQIRKKKLGLLISDARIASQRSSEECARVMGVDVGKYETYEKGETSPSLPEVEALAFFLNVPMSHFWGRASLSAEGFWETENIEQRQEMRRRSLGTQLKQARSESGYSLNEAAEQASISTVDLEAYETGEKAIPLPELESVSAVYQIEIKEFFDWSGPVGNWHTEKDVLNLCKELPVSIRKFIQQPVNYPYIEIAQKLSEMPAEKLRKIAESLLEITY